MVCRPAAVSNDHRAPRFTSGTGNSQASLPITRVARLRFFGSIETSSLSWTFATNSAARLSILRGLVGKDDVLRRATEQLLQRGHVELVGGRDERVNRLLRRRKCLDRRRACAESRRCREQQGSEGDGNGFHVRVLINGCGPTYLRPRPPPPPPRERPPPPPRLKPPPPPPRLNPPPPRDPKLDDPRLKSERARPPSNPREPPPNAPLPAPPRERSREPMRSPPLGS